MTDSSKASNQRRTVDITSKMSSSKSSENDSGLTDASKLIPFTRDGDRKRYDDVAPTISSDSLAVIRKKFHLPNEVLIITPKRSNKAQTPPPGFVAVYEMTLRAGLRFPPALELLDIFKACGIIDNNHRGLNMGHSCKWDRLKELPSSLYVGEEDILRILKFPDTKSLQQEQRYISQCVTEECLFKKKETTTLDIEAISLKAIKEFKKSAAYHREIQNRVQEAYEIFFDVESLEEGFTRGFLKGVWLVHRKTGVEIEGLTPSQASEDSSPDSGDKDIESELKKVLFSDDDVDIAYDVHYWLSLNPLHLRNVPRRENLWLVLLRLAIEDEVLGIVSHRRRQTGAGENIRDGRV
ncbi:hypothetical protein IEQ34_013863 [Dendrobium chrysotoxum]|uniref:Uncharacterized protein n=1 Tax=Dendrobium chrysotoxum TaxID=161865 RepID=A0AAV7GS47_DENCH|nr:hypothetical protein IEQ34_013863 [Dendrobium chrysotoxum]